MKNQSDNHQEINQLTTHLFRENSGKMVAVLLRQFGLSQIDFILDIVQDTFEAALMKWRFKGIPDCPSAWLMKVAKNKAINTFKRESKTQALSSFQDLAIDTEFLSDLSDENIKDSQLRLLMTCCQSQFSYKNQIILTLHILSGFGVPEIANALLMNEEAVKKALSRCKSLLKVQGKVLQNNQDLQSESHIQTVHTILYLLFNEGYKTTRSTTGISIDLCYEAIRLAKLLINKNEVHEAITHALLALMFFNLSRFPARLSEDGEWLSMQEQDRKLWNPVFIKEGFYYLNQAIRTNKLSRYHLEAIISSLHCSALNFEDTNWERIIYLYQQLEILEPDSVMITLNRIIAESYVEGTSRSMEKFRKLEGFDIAKTNFLFPATKGSLYQRNGAFENAIKCYEHAIQLTDSPIDKKFLHRKIKECERGNS